MRAARPVPIRPPRLEAWHAEVTRAGQRAELQIHRAAAREIRHSARRGLGSALSASLSASLSAPSDTDAHDRPCEPESAEIVQRELARLREARRAMSAARRTLRIAGLSPAAEAAAETLSAALADALRNIRL